MVVQYIETQLILDLCERSARRPGARVSWRWREQYGIDLEGGGGKGGSCGIRQRGYNKRGGGNAPIMKTGRE